ncbi:MBOAT family protein [Echinicola sp. CAU 1574]|uniref:MBOAT family protein n=1 Tax=Echinicola arenosa TaxID=2774144 RepID=A0ABR9ALF3_9BACT|nr:MBOAT family protein [Echinicola arenosa]MBD8488735.1 MBOAT family protein [Echinicola arenosa]
MLTTSLEFAVFLPCVFLLYWFVLNKNLKLQNALILVASYVFYGWWDWRFLLLIAFSSAVDFTVGILLNKTDQPSSRKWLLATSIFVNLGLLGFFKYFNFFLDSFVDTFTLFGANFSIDRLNIILPVGISFYTLQTLSYTIDVYDRKLKGSKDFLAFFAYVSFFPQLVAGPIERATQLLPQFQKKRTFEYDKAADGLRQILWGLFKKIVVADNLAGYTSSVIANYESHNGSTLFLALCVFAIQFYCDFSGYSDIAIGTGRLFGFSLMKNFDYPFFSRNMAELWQRWHISLITWFRDYLVRRFKGFHKWDMARNIFIIFLITGIWHGADWTYIIWGVLHGLLFMTLIFAKKRKKYKVIVAKGKLLPSLTEAGLMIKTFVLFTITGIFFLIRPLDKCFKYAAKMFDLSFFSLPELPFNRAIAAVVLLFVIEWFQREKEHGLDISNLSIPKTFKWGIYYALIFTIFYYGGDQQDFLYFQF